ncbi:hypothetical protein OO17_20620 [Rhodopseudomonas palustris]|uniref:Uncharacterized protein n=1 Tax=Rhodopseudomonas palustris TaxID=1076 RepID=A0A0D7EEX3_RHOPL|nr:hypothetical protein OO17_20620 [Rhodopseudomonas palustris]
MSLILHPRAPSGSPVGDAGWRPVPTGAREHEGRLTRTRKAADVNGDIHDAIARDGSAPCRIGLPLSDLPNG